MSPDEWYRSLPPVTKIWWTASVAVTIMVTMGALGPSSLYYDATLVLQKFHIWRVITNFFFFGPLGMSFVFQIVLLARYVNQLESRLSSHLNPTADLLTLLLFGVVCILLLDYFILPPLYFYGPSLVFMCMYVWSRMDPFADMVFYGFSFKQWHTPFVFLVVGIILGGSPMIDLLGIFIGHLYYFLVDLVPRNWNRTLIWTPQWMINAVKAAQQRLAAQPAAPNSAAPRPNWQQGQGYRLG